MKTRQYHTEIKEAFYNGNPLRSIELVLLRNLGTPSQEECAQEYINRLIYNVKYKAKGIFVSTKS